MFKSKQEWKQSRAMKFDSQMDAFIEMKRADQITKKQDQLVRLGREQSYIMELDMAKMNEMQQQFHVKRYTDLSNTVAVTEVAIAALMSNTVGSSNSNSGLSGANNAD